MESNNATHQLEMSRATPLTLREAIANLEERRKRIPRGWRQPFEKLLIDLRSVAFTRGSQCIPTGPQDALQIDPFTQTAVEMGRVLDGIFRKARARCSSTCEECGRRGKGRQLGFKRSVLCPACFARHSIPRQARRTRFLVDAAKANERLVILEPEIPALIRHLLPVELWRTFRFQQPKNHAAITMRYVNTAALAELCPRLETLENKCQELVGEMH